MAKLSKEEQALLTPEGFIKQFYTFCSEYNTQLEAYEAAERKFVSIYGKRKYIDFESFRQVRNRTLKK